MVYHRALARHNISYNIKLFSSYISLLLSLDPTYTVYYTLSYILYYLIRITPSPCRKLQTLTTIENLYPLPL
jgi:hypothetical protein